MVPFSSGRIEETLDRGASAGDSECADAIRDLVETVTIFRDISKPGGVEVEIVGRLTALLGEKAYPHGIRGVWGKMVAEERIRRNHPFVKIEV
jgi:site-specific DNA recombinase